MSVWELWARLARESHQPSAHELRCRRSRNPFGSIVSCWSLKSSQPRSRSAAFQEHQGWLPKTVQQLAARRHEHGGPLTDAMRVLTLGHDVRRLWDRPRSPLEFKKRILRTVLKEIIATSNGDTIHLLMHWQGGDHTELTFQKTRTGEHRYVTDAETVELIRSLARIQPDSMIASILNRMRRRTAHGQSWNSTRVCAMRNRHAIEAYREGERQARGEMTVSEVASLLRVTGTTVLRMIREKRLPATQVCLNAPWAIRRNDVDNFLAALPRGSSPQTSDPNQMALSFQEHAKECTECTMEEHRTFHHSSND
jgi:excisionase family DNA binding protein